MKVVELLPILAIAFLEKVLTCEEFRLRPRDNSVIVARSLEFDKLPLAYMVSEPSGVLHKGRVPATCSESTGTITWKNKYKILRPIGKPIERFGTFNCDTMNSEGLSVSALYLSQDKCRYPPIEDCGRTIAQFQVAEYIAALYKNVSEVEEAIEAGDFPSIWAELYEDEPLHLHWSITDVTGKSIIVEFERDGKRYIHNNTIGILTNDPNYKWHVENLNRYINVTNLAPENSTQVFATEIWPRLLGLPGDYTSPGRFMRAAVMSYFSFKKDTAVEAVNQAFHILNSLDITKGVLRKQGGEARNDHTFWVLVKDLTNKCTYYRDYEDLGIRRICFKDLPDNQTVMIQLEGDFMDGIRDMGKQMKPMKDYKPQDEKPQFETMY